MSNSSRTATSNLPQLSDAERKERAREKARLRKQRYDERIRSAAAEGGAGPRRGVVLHLSEAARTVLRDNRQRRRLAGLPAVLDSQLVESLLLAYAAQPASEQPSTTLVFDETKALAQVDGLLAAAQRLEKQLQAKQQKLFAAEGEIERLQEELKQAEDGAEADAEAEAVAMDWDEIEPLLLRMHRMFGRDWSTSIVEQVRADLGHGSSQTQAADDMHSAVHQYISDLVYKVRVYGYG